MYFGGVDTAETLRLTRSAGLEVESAEVVEQLEDDEPQSFLWLVARRPFEVDGPSASAAAVK
jgi:hypothetical protein